MAKVTLAALERAEARRAQPKLAKSCNFSAFTDQPGLVTSGDPIAAMHAVIDHAFKQQRKGIRRIVLKKPRTQASRAMSRGHKGVYVHFMDQRKDSGVSADAEGEGEQDGGRKGPDLLIAHLRLLDSSIRASLVRKSIFASLLFGYLALLVPDKAISGRQRPPAPIRNSDPAWSPDGSKIAFMSDRDNDIEIYVMEADGSHQRRLTNAPGRDAHPSWSPNGSKIYFQSPRNDPMPQIYVMNADGSEQKQLTHNAGFSGVPLCSPDGSRILFQVNENPTRDPSHWQIYVMNADGSRQRNLSKNGANDQVPRWSADGTRILFFSDISGKDQLYVMDADGSHRTRLTKDAFNDHTGVWSHDGKKIAFTSDRDGPWEIYTAAADGSNVLRLTHNAPGFGLPQWSPDDSQIVFSVADGENRDIYVMNSNGTQVRRLTCGAGDCPESSLNSSALQEHKDLGAQPGMASALTGFLTSKDGVHLYYAKVGSGTKTVIIVPGRLFAFRDFHGLAKGRTLIFYDMRNRGRSDAVLDPSKIGLQHDADDLQVVRAHFGIEKPDLTGFSYLGKIVVLYANATS